MKILVTGANGYLGSGIVKKLLDLGHEVVASCINDVRVDKRAKIKQSNLFEIDDPYVYFDKPDIVLHLAWKDGFVHNAESHINNLPFHCKFIDRIMNSNCKQISIMGSMHEVGFYEGSIDENSPCNPQSNYGIAKNALREYAFLKCKDSSVRLQWLRAFYIVGNYRYGNSIFSKISQAVDEGKKEFPFTMGLNQFDFLDYGIFCDYVAKTICQDKFDGIINICSGRPEKLSDRVEKFIKDNDYDIKLIYGAFPDRSYDSKAVWGDNNKLSQIINEYN